MDDIDARISRALDQLENPNLSVEEQERLEDRLKFLQGLRP